MALNDFTLVDVYRRNAMFFSNRIAFVFEGQRITHSDYLHRIERLAAGLAERGVKPGDRVAILSLNSLEMIDVIGAVAMLGAILLPINYRLNTDEIGYVLADGAPSVIIAGQEYLGLVAALAPTLASVHGLFGIGRTTEPFLPFIELYTGGTSLPEVDPDPDDGFVIIHTAAVGGRPRGALLSQTNLLTAQSSLVETWGLTEADVNFGALPLFHVAGLGLMLTLQQVGGASIIVSKFDPQQAIRQIADERVSVMSEFAPMLANMMDIATIDDLSTLRTVTGLDTAATIERFEAAYPGATFWATFGQSETSGLATLSPHRARPKSAGRPLFWRTIAIVDAADVPKPVGQTGEIVVRGPIVFKGYWNNEAETAFTLRNGWHHTGDLGYFDADGYLWYIGRAPEKELIKTGGENVYPAEVENAIRRHSDIADVVVIGVPDPQWSEAIKAICVRREGATVVAEEVIDFVATQIARYKRPKHVVFVQELPKTDNGEIDRATVKSQYA